MGLNNLRAKAKEKADRKFEKKVQFYSKVRTQNYCCYTDYKDQIEGLTVLHQLASCILIAGILCVYINYDCDRQRQEFLRTNGKFLVWGKAPSKIVASYTTESGETKTILLLTSGWWGLARHFHYVPEISAAFFWTVPALFSHFLPYFYVIFLTILLFDRAKRDDDRCQSK